MLLGMSRDPRVDAYIARSAPFAQPILKHIREAVHAGCPEVVETIKWNVPAFEYKGPFCGMAAFKKHTMFGFWKYKLLIDQLPKGDHKAFGRFGRLTSMADVPGKAEIVKFVKAAKKLNDNGVKAPRMARVKKAPVRVPAYFTAALKKSPKAASVFAAMPPSHKREYVEWITDAKGLDTRERRIKQAVEWIGQGKSRNWKYQP
jgi:hypothetical protein